MTVYGRGILLNKIGWVRMLGFEARTGGNRNEPLTEHRELSTMKAKQIVPGITSLMSRDSCASSPFQAPHGDSNSTGESTMRSRSTKPTPTAQTAHEASTGTAFRPVSEFPTPKLRRLLKLFEEHVTILEGRLTQAKHDRAYLLSLLAERKAVAR